MCVCYVHFILYFSLFSTQRDVSLENYGVLFFNQISFLCSCDRSLVNMPLSIALCCIVP